MNITHRFLKDPFVLTVQEDDLIPNLECPTWVFVGTGIIINILFYWDSHMKTGFLFVCLSGYVRE